MGLCTQHFHKDMVFKGNESFYFNKIDPSIWYILTSFPINVAFGQTKSIPGLRIALMARYRHLVYCEYHTVTLRLTSSTSTVLSY